MFDATEIHTLIIVTYFYLHLKIDIRKGKMARLKFKHKMRFRSFVGKDFFRIKWRFKLNYTL